MWIDYAGWHTDVTGPLMVVTQKLSMLAYNLYDGERVRAETKSKKKDPTLLNSQRERAVTELPPLLDYCAYTLCFVNILAGPSMEYSDFMGAVTQTSYEGKDAKTGVAHRRPSLISLAGSSLLKVILAVVCIVIHLKGAAMFRELQHLFT